MKIYAFAPYSTATTAVLLALAASVVILSRIALAVDVKAGPQIIDNFLDEIEIQAFLEALSSTEVLHPKDYEEGEALVYMGRSPVGPAFLGRLLQAISSTSTSCIEGDAVCHVSDDEDTINPSPIPPVITHLKTVTIHEGSTVRHMDSYCATGGGFVEDPIGMVYLNDNEDATFFHGDARVTPQRGRLVIFMGNVYHQTNVRKGRVSLLGPFLWAPTLNCTGYAGGPPPTPFPTPAPSPAPSTAPTPAPSTAPTPAPSTAPTPAPTTKGTKKGSTTKAPAKKTTKAGKGNLIVWTTPIIPVIPEIGKTNHGKNHHQVCHPQKEETPIPLFLFKGHVVLTIQQ
jgi:hypothetical protein